MEVIENFTGTRATIFYVLLFLLFIGGFIIFIGYKNLKTNKTVGVISLVLGIIFSLVVLYFMLINLLFGFNY